MAVFLDFALLWLSDALAVVADVAVCAFHIRALVHTHALIAELIILADSRGLVTRPVQVVHNTLVHTGLAVPHEVKSLSFHIDPTDDRLRGNNVIVNGTALNVRSWTRTVNRVIGSVGRAK